MPVVDEPIPAGYQIEHNDIPPGYVVDEPIPKGYQVETPVATKPRPDWMARYDDTPENRAANNTRSIRDAVRSLQRGVGKESQFNDATIDALQPDELSTRYKDLHGIVSKQADDLITTGHVNFDKPSESPAEELAKSRLVEEARAQAKADPHGVARAAGGAALQGQAGGVRGVMDWMSKQAIGGVHTDERLRRQSAHAMDIARNEEHPYATAIGQAGGKLLSPEMVAAMVAAAPVKGASAVGNYARGVGAFTAEQTGEQYARGEPVTPIKNAAANAAMFGAGGLTGAAGEALGGGIKTVAAKAIGGGIGQAGVSAGVNAAEGKEFSGPQAAADLVAGAAGALAHAPADLKSAYVEHVREMVKNGTPIPEAHAKAKEITRAETPTAQPAPSVSAPAAESAKEITNDSSKRSEQTVGPVQEQAPSSERSGETGQPGPVRVPSEAANEQVQTGSETPVAVKGGNWREVVDASSNPSQKSQILRHIADARNTPQGLSDILDKVSGLPDETNIEWAVAKNPAATPEIKARALKMREDWFDQPIKAESEASRAVSERVATQVPMEESPKGGEGIRQQNTQEQETPLQVPQGEGRGPAKPARENAVSKSAGDMILEDAVQSGHLPGEETNIGSDSHLAINPDTARQEFPEQFNKSGKLKANSPLKKFIDEGMASDQSASERNAVGRIRQHIGTRAAKLESIRKAYAEHPDPNMRMLFAQAQAENQFGRPSSPMESAKVKQFSDGDTFSIGGRQFRVEVNADGETVFHDHDIPDIAAEGLASDKFRIDKGSHEQAAEPEFPEGDFAPKSISEGDTEAARTPLTMGQRTFHGEVEPSGIAGKQASMFGRIGGGPKGKTPLDLEVARQAAEAREQVGAGQMKLDIPDDKLQGRTSLLEGPGGSTGTDKAFREQTSISNLTDKIATMPKPIGETRVAKMMASAQNLVGGVKDSPSKVGNQLAKLRAGMAAIYHAYASEPGKGDFDTANRKWSGADNESAHEVEKFRKEAKAKVPDPVDRQAVSIFLESGGDAKKLAEWKAAIEADPKLAKYRRVFDRAANLPDNLKAVSTDTDLHHQATLDEAVKAGVLKDGLENYIMHVWKDPEVQRKIAGEASFNSLITNPSFAKKRVIPTYFDGIKRGLVPESLDFADLTAVHERSFREALAARGYIKTLYEGKAKDGRPLATVSPASARTIEEGKGAVLIRPNMKAGEPNGDYKAIDHPSLRGWKWAATVDGKPVMVQGDMMVHPEIYQHLKNNLTKSAIQQWEVNLGGKVIHPGAIALKANAELKHLILSLSAFHQTTLGVHALEHRTKPFGMPELDFSDPVQKDLVQHGLMVAHYSGADAFNEGLSGGGLISKVPGIGPRYQQYVDYLFKSYLPRIKMAMAQNALKRNTEVYGDKLTKDQILNLSADQANAAFGGVNLRVLGRSKTFQDVARLALMAPDFLEARARFVGQAAKPYGREQATALIIGALGMYTASKLLNAALSKDHDPRLLDPNPFSVHVGDSDYAFRTIQGDIVDAIEDPLKFARNRFSPLMKFATESATGKDRFGQQQGLKDRILQAARGEVPIPFQPWVQKPEESAVQKTLESIFKMVGINKKSTAKEDMSAKKSGLAQGLRSGQSEDVVEGEVGKDALTRSEAREVYSRSNYVDDAAYNFTNLRTDKMVSNLESMKPADRRKPLYRDDPSGYSYLDRAEDSIGKSPSLSETDRKALQKRIDKLKTDKR